MLLYAQLRGNNQGLIKLVSGALNIQHSCADKISVTRQSKVTAVINGEQHIGMAVVATMVDIAISKVKEHGVAVVTGNNYSSATGAMGYWAKKITDAGYIGIIMSQCPEMVAPYGSCEPIFGTNPIAIGIPTSPRAQILDMATSAEAWFGLVTAKAEGRSIPADIAYDREGLPTTSPGEALLGALRGFDRSYKSSHLGLM